MSHPPSIHRILKRARHRVIELHRKSNTGHIGGNLSCIDSLVVLQHLVLGKDDVLLLSKGHSAGALYTALWSSGIISDEELNTFACDGTRLGVHPPVNLLEAIPFGTGSLGHGPSLAVGIALGRRLQGIPGRVFCLCSDGEWQEGSCWEALTSAVHQHLDALRLIVDVNGLQGFGTTEDVASISCAGLAMRFEAFGAYVRHCNGHDPEEMVKLFSEDFPKGTVSVVLMETCKGKGLPFFENTLASHYLPLTDEQYRLSCQLFGDNE